LILGQYFELLAAVDAADELMRDFAVLTLVLLIPLILVGW
jgi:hypothetical protein